METFKQQKDYTCGVASVRTLISNYFNKIPSENKLEDTLDTTKEYGTTLNEILLYLSSKNILLKTIPTPNKRNIGICLLNVNTLYKEFPRDGQNGHWVYFERKNNVILFYDPYKDVQFQTTIDYLINNSKNVKIKDKIYNNVILYTKPLNMTLEEASRWKEESMKLSPKSIKRIEKSGIRKPDSILADGIWTGTKNILKKHSPETTINYSKMPGEMYFSSLGGRFHKDENTNTIFVNKDANIIRRLASPTDKVFGSKEGRLLNDALNGRHEAYEAKYHQTGKDAGNIYKVNNRFQKMLNGEDHTQIGNHFTAKVLTKEANDTNKLGYTKTGKAFNKDRQEENNIIKRNTGVDLNNINNNNLRKANKRIDNYEKDRDYYV